MNTKNFFLDIVTPTGTVLSAEIQSFSAPGVVGSFQVLFNHAPFLSSIGIGEVKVVDTTGKTSRYATSGGFVEVKGNRVILLAETIELKENINIERATDSRKRAMMRLSRRDPELDLERARVSLTRAMNRLKVAGRM